MPDVVSRRIAPSLRRMSRASATPEDEALDEAAFAESPEALVLEESGQRLADDQTDRDGNPLPAGTYKVHIIRPGVGRGRGRHLYEAKMLEEHAHLFKGWKQFLNHLSPAARKAAGGLPRDFEHLGGSIKESWWDPTVPATDRFDKGAVVGISKPVGLAKTIIQDDPEIAELSISAHATGVKAIQHKGERVLLVEGIHPTGSVDWVTQAGAGGKIAGLAEALIESGDFEDPNAIDDANALAEMDDDALVEYLRESRPELTEALGLPDPDDGAAGDDDADVENGLGVAESAPHMTAEPAATAPGGDMTITPEMLREALADPEVKDTLRGLFAAETQVQLEEQAAEFDARAESIRAEARADADRAIQLTRLEGEAIRLIEAAKLPTGWEADLKSRFSLDESGFPTDALDVVDVYDNGVLVKRASAVLTEALSAEIKRATDLLAEVRPTRVRGQGAAQPTAAAERVEEAADDKPVKPAPKADKPFWAEYLAEAGIDPDKSYTTAL